MLPSTAKSTTSAPEPRPFPFPTSSQPVIARFSSESFVLGAGVAIFHVASSRVVVCSAYDARGRRYYFLPKGRRDAGEESGPGAEREGYEESGYRNRLLPLPTSHRQPQPHPRVSRAPLTAEPVWIQMMPMHGRYQYILHWYIAETLPPDVEKAMDTHQQEQQQQQQQAQQQPQQQAGNPSSSLPYQPPPPFPTNLTLRSRIALEPPGYEPIHHENTGVDEDERSYKAHLLPILEAVQKLGGGVSSDVVMKGWGAIQERLRMEEDEERSAEELEKWRASTIS